MMFENLGLGRPILRAVRAEGYQTATPIQAEAIPQVLGGRDLIGCAQTGTGKTAAFALPTLQRLCARAKELKNGSPGREAKHGRIRALILSPTRELAAQIGESLSAYGKFTGLRHTVVYGGVSQVPQVRALRRGIDTLVGTPGRILDLITQGHIDLRGVEILVLDEADRMLDMGFIHDLRRIVVHVPRRRQTLMFSATMPDEILKLTAEWLREPVRVQVGPTAAPVEEIEQSVYYVEPRQKLLLLADFLQNTPSTRTLVFSRTKYGADKIVRQLLRRGIRAAAIHGNKSQGARQRVLEDFKSDRPPVLVATDVAARGLDIDGISHVVNYDLPEVPETYVHRIGRTGRAGATGIAVSFCTSDQRPLLRRIERLTRRAITVQPHESQPSSGGVTVAATGRQSAGPESRPKRQGRSKSRGLTQNGRHKTGTSRGRTAKRRQRRLATCG
jgi:ATP-dependent RNA helicase RhlE